MSTETAGWRSHRDRLYQWTAGQILDIACRQVREGGWDALTARGVAREMGMTSPAVWHYYADIGALRTSVMRVLAEELTEAATAAHPAEPEPVALARELAVRPDLWPVLCRPESPIAELLVEALGTYRPSE